MAIPSLAMIPSGYKDGKVYSVLPANGDGDFTFSRNSSATRVNKDGFIETVTGDTPRLDYSDSSCPSLLLEPQITNLFEYSEDFGNSYWTNSGSSESSGFISPDGTNNAFKLIENTDTVEHYIGKSIANPTGFYTWSLFVKAEERKYIVFRTNADGGAYKNSCFDIESGTIVYDGLHQSKAEIQPLNNGWFRVSAYVKETSGTTRNYHIHISDSPVTDNGTISYQGDGVSGVYVYGAQIEEGSYATSYIPTNGAIATRLADVCNGAGTSDTFNDSEGVFFAEVASLDEAQGTSVITISDSSLSNRILIAFVSGELRGEFVTAGGAITINSSGLVIENFNKIACSYTATTFKVFVNGSQVGTTSTVTTPISGVMEIAFDRGDGSNNFYGNTKQIQYYNTALTDAELKALTT